MRVRMWNRRTMRWTDASSEGFPHVEGGWTAGLRRIRRGGGTGSLQVKTGSHEGHRDFFRNASAVPLQEQAQMKDDFYLYKPSELGYFDKYETVALEGGAGSLFLWDSRTAHMVRSPSPACPAFLWPRMLYSCFLLQFLNACLPH